MTINIAGNWGEFYCNIAIDGDNASIMMDDANGIITRRGKVTAKEDDKSIIKTKITKTTEKYDKDGKLVEKITREETTEDDTVYKSGSIIYPQEPTKQCCECKCELRAEDIIKSVRDYERRTGKSLFLL